MGNRVSLNKIYSPRWIYPLRLNCFKKTSKRYVLVISRTPGLCTIPRRCHPVTPRHFHGSLDTPKGSRSSRKGKQPLVLSVGKFTTNQRGVPQMNRSFINTDSLRKYDRLNFLITILLWYCLTAPNK